MNPLPDQAATYAAERTTPPGGRVELQRALMAGALAALTSKATREQLLAECIGFGRTIGSPAERATT